MVTGDRPVRARAGWHMDGYLGSYATLGLLLVVGVGFFAAAFGANKLLSPANPAEPHG